jgi:hypothetical protein
MAKKILVDALADSGLTRRELAEKLKEQGADVTTQVLINKLNRRGTYSFVFALQVLAALGKRSVPVPKLPRSLRGLPPRHPAVPDPDEE